MREKCTFSTGFFPPFYTIFSRQKAMCLEVGVKLFCGYFSNKAKALQKTPKNDEQVSNSLFATFFKHHALEKDVEKLIINCLTQELRFLEGLDALTASVEYHIGETKNYNAMKLK